VCAVAKRRRTLPARDAQQQRLRRRRRLRAGGAAVRGAAGPAQGRLSRLHHGEESQAGVRMWIL
jgi:hypothetical protein